MQELVSKAENENIIFVEDFRELKGVKNLALKKLCIIKTDFKNINQIKKFCKTHPNLEVWIASDEISRKNILSANSCGVKNVVKYPVDTKLIHNFFRKKDKTGEIKQVSTSNYYLKGLKVMIVDDNQMNIDLLKETLSDMGLELSAFTKPLEAAKIIEYNKYDLFLLDIMMPEMSGFDLAEVIKKTKLNSDTPIMFISALNDPENKIRGFDLGSYAYIEKPFNINVVRSQIYNALKINCLREALNDRKETFLAMVTHDLKTPVNAEICALELLLKNNGLELNEMQHEIIKDILGAAKYMKNLVDNILHKYKFDNENLKLNKKQASLKVLIAECIEETKYLFEEKHQQLMFNCSSRNSETMVDCIEIKRVIQNLLFNSVEYAYKNSKITIELYETKTDFVFSIKNFSHGIDLANPNDVFEKFVTLAEQNKRAGTGLGLYICKKIIEAHGGNIYAESKVDDYTKITFTLPKMNI